MLLTFLVYVLGYVPSITYAILVSKGFKVDDIWFVFFALFCPFVASGCNPIIYALRARRFRHAAKQFWKDPCGKSPLQEFKEERAARESQQKKPAGAHTSRLHSVHVQGHVSSNSIKRGDDGMIHSHSMEVNKINERNEKNTGRSKRCTSLSGVAYTTTHSPPENSFSENSRRKSVWRTDASYSVMSIP